MKILKPIVLLALAIKGLATARAQDPLPSWNDGPAKQSITAFGEKGILEIVAATHAGMSTAEFEKIVTDWITTARCWSGPKREKARA